PARPTARSRSRPHGWRSSSAPSGWMSARTEHENGRHEALICPTGQAKFLLFRRLFFFRYSEIYDLFPPSRLDEEGRSANRHQTWSAGCDGRERPACNPCTDEWCACGRRSRVVLAPLGWCQVLRTFRKATVTNKVMDTGESTSISVKTIAQGMSVVRLHLR